MKRFFVLILTLCLLGIVLAACTEQKPAEEEETTIENDAAVQGKWTEDYFDSGYTFNADGTGMDEFWELSFTYTAHDGVLTIIYDDETFAKASYTYTVDDTSITMTQKADSGKSYTYHKSN